VKEIYKKKKWKLPRKSRKRESEKSWINYQQKKTSERQLPLQMVFGRALTPTSKGKNGVRTMGKGS